MENKHTQQEGFVKEEWEFMCFMQCINCAVLNIQMSLWKGISDVSPLHSTQKMQNRSTWNVTWWNRHLALCQEEP